MRAVVAVKSTGGKGASRATRYISERDRDPEREGSESRPLFSERENRLTYRKADRFLNRGHGTPDKEDLIHFSVSFLPEEYERLGESAQERKERLREAAREAIEGLTSDLGAEEMRWVAGIHLNTDHPHLHVLLHKEITDRKTGETRRIGKIPKRLLPHTEPGPDGKNRPVEGVIGARFTTALDHEKERAREEFRHREAEAERRNIPPSEKEKFPSLEERLLDATERNPSMAGRELIREILLRSPEPGPDDSPDAANLRDALRSRAIDDPDYRSQPEQADFLGRQSKETRDLYERGASLKGEVLFLPAEEHELTNASDDPFLTSLAYAHKKIGDPAKAAEFHSLAKTIAGETADARTGIEIFRYYYAQARPETIEQTLDEMRLLAAEMARLETRESVEVFAEVVSLDEARSPGGNTVALSTAARKVDLQEEALRFPAGLDPERKERLVTLTLPSLDRLIESGKPREAIHSGIDLVIYDRASSPEERAEFTVIGRFLKSYVDKRLKDPETRALNRSEAFREAHAKIIEARTPEELNRAAEGFLRKNLARSQNPDSDPTSRALNARERNLLFFGRAPVHHTAEMRELRYAWGLSREERTERVRSLHEGKLSPSPTLETMLAELDSRRNLPSLRHFQASILNEKMRNPGKIELRPMFERLAPHERSYLIERVNQRKETIARGPNPFREAGREVRSSPAAEIRQRPPAPRSQPAPQEETVPMVSPSEPTRVAGAVARVPDSPPGKAVEEGIRRENLLEWMRDRVALGDAIVAKARYDCAKLDFEMARDHGESFRFELHDESLGGERRISQFDLTRRAGARGARAADEQEAGRTERREIRQQIADADLARHTGSLQAHAQILEGLIAKLEGNAETALADHLRAEARAQEITRKYESRGEEVPAPFIKRETLVEVEGLVIGHRLPEQAETFERLRVALVAEHGRPLRSEEEAARLSAQLIIARSELGSRQERATAFDQTRHLRQWEIGDEKWSLADLDRRVETLRDEAQLLGRYQFHLNPFARHRAGDEIERLATIREEIIGKIGTRREELGAEVREAGKLVEVLFQASERETALRAQSGPGMPAPQFTRKELDLIAANAETMRDGPLLKEVLHYERAFNIYGPKEEHRTPERELGRALARGVMAEIHHRESSERILQFHLRSELVPLLIETPDGRLLTHRLKETQPRSLAERVLRPLVEKPEEREFRDAVLAAFAGHEKHLLDAAGKSQAYLAATREIAGELRAGAEKHAARPEFTPKEQINIEIYAERLTDRNERQRLLDLARGVFGERRDARDRNEADPGRTIASIARELLSQGAGRGR